MHVSQDRPHRVADVLADYAEHRNAGWRADNIRIIADTSNEDIDTCNRFAQRYRLRHGEIGNNSFEVHDESQGRRWELRENDAVTFLRSYFVKGQTPVKNGTEGVLVSLDTQTGRARVRTTDADGRYRVINLRLSTQEHQQVLGLNYASHANRIHGGEIPIVLAMPGSGQTNANSGYSMVTRSTHETHIYLDRETHSADPLNVLGKAWTEREVKQSAMSKLNDIRREEWQRAQRDEPQKEPERVALEETPEPEPVPALEEVGMDRLRAELERLAFDPKYLQRRREGLDRGPDGGIDLGM